MKIVEIHKHPDLFKNAVQVFWKQWGNASNYPFYHDCMLHSGTAADGIPRFYAAVENERIIGTYALIRNDLNSRQDLYPWLACVYVDEEYRGRRLGSQLLDHAIGEAAGLGFEKLYLTTDLEGYYEKYGWTHSGEVYGAFGSSMKLYRSLTGSKTPTSERGRMNG
ncbi:GNAT family N-acetyltransferase [Cytobacillus sp. NCCP-133]|uniref:GNAT family N-acetyltransferase n=1 Tax=Cytobacillus sp. NCCP-133 TaxID=766848 RepID=UPI0022302640|nr:GNAT family N-acetyltransferase [Cytobacillus sp. NCCP-133]GLB61429.1 N-acetyltransferase [Cytobacillus sp. NCCP-133]